MGSVFHRVRQVAGAVLFIVLGAEYSSAETIIFQFSGAIRYAINGPLPDLAVGDQYSGWYSFESTAAGIPVVPVDSTLDVSYPGALTQWYFTVPSRGIVFGGVTGDIVVGNNTSFSNGDRYFVHMPTVSGQDLTPSGNQLLRMSVDLIDKWYLSAGPGNDFLQDTTIQTSPPPLELTYPADRLTHFVFSGNYQFQGTVTSLTVVPEPSAIAFSVMSGILALCAARFSRKH